MSGLTGTHIESKIKALLDLIGGSGFSGGAPYSAAGALGRPALSSLIRIGNAHKNEPYAERVMQLRVGRAVVGTAALAYQQFPVRSASDHITIDDVSFQYTALTVGTSANITLQVITGSNQVAIETFDLGPGVVHHVSVLIGPALTDVSVGASITVNSISPGGGGTDYIIDPVITVSGKSLHVA